MGPFKGLNVEVISNNESLKHYEDPDDVPRKDSRVRQHYIEAVTGATFTVKVTLNKSFKLYGLKYDDGVRVSVIYDNQKPMWYHDLTVLHLRSSWNKGKAAEWTFGHISKFDEVSQQWKQGAMTFCALKTKDTADTSSSVDQTKDLGQIKVKVERVFRTQRAVPLSPTGLLSKPISEVSEKMLKGKAIVSTIQTTNDVVSQAPPPTTHDITPIPGEHGQTLTSIIFYRPRSSLQMLGCIPRSPSPEPEPRLPGPKAAGREQKIQELKAQLALLERDTVVKPEGPDVKRRIKRELADTEDLQITEARSANKRPRRSGPVETVDLTSD